MSAGDMTLTDTEAEARWGTQPGGVKPRRFSPARLGIYGFLVISALFFLIPLYVMIVTSLKTMPEIRLGHLFSLPGEVTFQPWVDAWLNACTGRDCNGLHPGFLNSLKITIPSVVVSIIIASINGYALGTPADPEIEREVVTWLKNRSRLDPSPVVRNAADRALIVTFRKT